MAAVGITLACTARRKTTDVALLFPDSPIFSILRGIRPGISVAELRKLRPAVVETPYVGMVELINRDTVRYLMVSPPRKQSRIEDALFGPSVMSEQELIEGIDWWQWLGAPGGRSGNEVSGTGAHLDAADTADRVWAQRVRLLRRHAGNAIQCFTIDRSGTTQIALARRGENWFGATFRERHAERDFLGNVTTPALLDTFVASRLEFYVPSKFARTPIRCLDLA